MKLTIIYPCIPTIMQYGYKVCHSVLKSSIIPEPMLPILETLWVFPYLCGTLVNNNMNKGGDDVNEVHTHH